jgi:hypothetical protein
LSVSDSEQASSTNDDASSRVFLDRDFSPACESVLIYFSLSGVVQLREGAERLFDKHDVDGSGTLDIQEIVGVLKSLGKVHCGPSNSRHQYEVETCLVR